MDPSAKANRVILDGKTPDGGQLQVEEIPVDAATQRRMDAVAAKWDRIQQRREGSS